MPLLEVNNLTTTFPMRGGILNRIQSRVHAVSDVSLHVDAGETLGIVGESGCGKSTLARTIVRLLNPDSGSIRFAGTDIGHLSQRALRPLRRDMQMIFQDPVSSLNPRMMVGNILAEPYLIHGMRSVKERRKKVAALLEQVGLSPEVATRYPHEFSGGQRQRIGIARAIALKPKLVICDEPVSALDVSVQGEIVNLLLDLQKDMGLSYIFIAHDLKVVAQMSHRIAVMYLGRIVETFPASRIQHVQHPYSQALMAAVPVPDPELRGTLRPIEGDVPSPIAPPPGCAFFPRCAYGQAGQCQGAVPPLDVCDGDAHRVACYFPQVS